jgi:hypothetical protein
MTYLRELEARQIIHRIRTEYGNVYKFISRLIQPHWVRIESQPIWWYYRPESNTFASFGWIFPARRPVRQKRRRQPSRPASPCT